MRQGAKRASKEPNVLEKIRGCLESGRYLETIHATQRKLQRGIILQDILHILRTGWHEKQKDRFDEVFQDWNYAIRGFLVDGDELRVIVSFDEEDGMLIITTFYLEGAK